MDMKGIISLETEAILLSSVALHPDILFPSLPDFFMYLSELSIDSYVIAWSSTN